jgi:hypothetical protein
MMHGHTKNKPVQHVTVLNAVGNCNTVVSITILYCNITGPPSYMRSVVGRNVGMRRISLSLSSCAPDCCDTCYCIERGQYI